MFKGCKGTCSENGCGLISAANTQGVVRVMAMAISFMGRGKYKGSAVSCIGLTHLSLASHKWDIAKERRPR